MLLVGVWTAVAVMAVWLLLLCHLQGRDWPIGTADSVIDEAW